MNNKVIIMQKFRRIRRTLTLFVAAVATLGMMSGVAIAAPSPPTDDRVAADRVASTSSPEKSTYTQRSETPIAAVGAADSGRATPGIQRSPAVDDVNLSYTFSRAMTKKIYDTAVSIGEEGVYRICTAVTLGLVKEWCRKIAKKAMQYVIGNPPNGRCLRVSIDLWPPWSPSVGLKYVTC